ncbi:LPS assembly protein LptD [Desulfatiferula olefinivorans]
MTAPPVRALDKDMGEGPWQIVADRLDYDRETGIYTADGHVTISRDNQTIDADYLEYDRMAGATFARGHVVLTSRDGDRASADRLLLNLNTDQGTLYEGSIFLAENHVYIRGERIRKTGETTYAAEKVSITSCDGDRPDWQFTGYDMTVTIEGYGQVFHAAFWAKRLPLLYSPFLVFPVKIKRQSGLLPPEISQSERKGTDYLQPYYWAVNDNSDATFYLRSMSRRGVMKGLEYRYMQSDTSLGTLMADYLTDRRTDDGSEESTRLWGYDDSVNRPNTKRYWIRTKQNQTLPDGSTIKLDTDIVSDQDYLREFSAMKNGFEAAKDVFTDTFGRDLEEDDDYIRTNSLIYNKRWTSFNFSASTYWYDHVVNRRTGRDDTTLQKLPTLDFLASRRRLWTTPLYYDLDSEYTYFFRQDTTERLRTGRRADVYPRLILPMRAKNLFSLESTVGVRNTYWNIDDEDETQADLNGSHFRSIYDLSFDLSTDFYRIFRIDGDRTDRIKHSITPKLVYAYTPDKDQTDYPYFTALDRIEPESTLTLSLNNILTSRFRDDDPEKPAAKPKYGYRQFCRFKLEQVYDMNEARERDVAQLRNKESREPFLPLYGEILFSPRDYLNLSADASWSHYDRHLTEGNLTASIHDRRGDRLSVEHRYTRDDVTAAVDDGVKYLRTFAHVVLTDQLAVYGENERNLLDREDLKSSAGVIYTSQCWGVTFDYTHEPGDKRYTMTFNLSGLGEFGSSFSADQAE